MKLKNVRVFGLLCLLFALCLPISAQATQVQSAETKGTVGFTGVYEPIGTPDPKPPELIVKPPATGTLKPGGSLPQTNSETHSWLMWLGLLLVGFVFYMRKRTKQQNTN
jgi:LPXTG-motif cell wall-anchored protein